MKFVREDAIHQAFVVMINKLIFGHKFIQMCIRDRSQGMGAHKVRFLDSVNAGDELTLKASTRQCLKNGSQTPKDVFYQYSAAWDSKHTVKLEERKSARVLFEFQEMQEGGDRL